MFHREGYKVILLTTIAIGVGFIFIDKFVTNEFFNRGLSIGILFIYLFILQQFRAPKRAITTNSEAILSPVDGKIKAIEEIDLPNSEEKGFIISFYVSPINFHVIRAPFEGRIVKNKYDLIGDSNLRTETLQIHNSPSNNLETTIHIYPAQFSQNATIYPEKNSDILQGEEIGFIKFDGKVTMIVPKTLKLEVKINDRVKAGEHIIATI